MAQFDKKQSALSNQYYRPFRWDGGGDIDWSLDP
jgi:hypothetical protein